MVEALPNLHLKLLLGSKKQRLKGMKTPRKLSSNLGDKVNLGNKNKTLLFYSPINADIVRAVAIIQTGERN